MNIIGHEKIIKFLDKACTKNQLAGAYLFSGFSGVGKFQVALYFAEKILGQSWDKISDELIVLEPDQKTTSAKAVLKDKDTKSDKAKNEKREIKVEEIRELRRKIFLTSASGKKVAVIRGAEKLNKSSQNALLKILEEPTVGLTIILVADDERKLFPTIVSRCQKIRFGIASEEEISHLIDSQEKKISSKIKQAIIFWSLGRPGLALEMLQNPEELKFKIQSFGELKNLSEETVLNKFSLAENLSKDTNLALRKMDVWTMGIRESLLKGKIDFFSQEKCLEIIDKISESQNFLKQTNANAKLILENLFLTFSRNKR
jgi:DNA polymerase III subunit delta'